MSLARKTTTLTLIVSVWSHSREADSRLPVNKFLAVFGPEDSQPRLQKTDAMMLTQMSVESVEMSLLLTFVKLNVFT
jgi:hypothetical protein